MRLTRLLSLTLLFLACFTALADACPTCRQGLTDGQHANMVQGYFWSIVFMMSMPFLIFASLASYFYFQVARVRRSGTVRVTNRSEGVTGGEYGQRPTPA